jgi:hypothetical protein
MPFSFSSLGRGSKSKDNKSYDNESLAESTRTAESSSSTDYESLKPKKEKRKQTDKDIMKSTFFLLGHTIETNGFH